MHILTVDFETYYDKQFSLSKITTEAYIRDPQFEVVGVSVQIDDQAPEWFSGTMEETGEWLRQFDWGNSIGVAHNAMFDMAILNWHFGIRPKRIVDTLSMARAIHGTEVGGSLAALVEHYGLGAKGTEVINALGKRRLDFSPEELAAYGGYCDNDVVLTYQLFKRLLAEGFPVDELRLIDVTIRMFSEPVLQIDGALLEKHLLDIQNKKHKLLSKALVDKEDLMSNPKFAALLVSCNVVPPTKISPTTGKETYAFAKKDEEFMALLEHEDVLVQSLVAARLGLKSTIEETRTERFIEISKRGSLPVPLKYSAALSHRWGGMDSLNMQNIPRGSVIKQAIVAPPGYVLADVDSSQIEARTLAWWAGQDDLVAAFERGDDVYKIMASDIYGKPATDITKDERFVGKSVLLGAGYGLGYRMFHKQLQNFGVTLPIEECERIISIYRNTYEEIPKLWKQGQEALYAIMHNQTMPLGKDGVVIVEGARGVRLPNGLYVKYPNLRLVKNDEGRTEFVYDEKRGRAVIPTRTYGANLIQNVTQALARIVVGEQLLRVAKKYKVATTVHDAVCAVIPESEAQRGLEYVELCMKIRPTWAPDLPLNCEGGVAREYGNC